MEKKRYIAPMVSYIGPDIREYLETNSPISVAVATSVGTSITTALRVWF